MSNLLDTAAAALALLITLALAAVLSGLGELIRRIWP